MIEHADTNNAQHRNDPDDSKTLSDSELREGKLLFGILVTLWVLFLSVTQYFGFVPRVAVLLASFGLMPDADDYGLRVVAAFLIYFVVIAIIPVLLVYAIEQWLHRRRHRHDRGVSDSAPQT